MFRFCLVSRAIHLVLTQRHTRPFFQQMKTTWIPFFFFASSPCLLWLRLALAVDVVIVVTGHFSRTKLLKKYRTTFLAFLDRNFKENDKMGFFGYASSTKGWNRPVDSQRIDLAVTVELFYLRLLLLVGFCCCSIARTCSNNDPFPLIFLKDNLDRNADEWYRRLQPLVSLLEIEAQHLAVISVWSILRLRPRGV